jgi:predicted Zn-dependent protease
MSGAVFFCTRRRTLASRRWRIPVSADLLTHLRAQIDGPRDGPMLRYAIGAALLEAGDPRAASDALRSAVGFDRDYSAAWKLLGKALVQCGDQDGAAAAWRDGIDAAMRRGDKQAEREMQVFLRRLERH